MHLKANNVNKFKLCTEKNCYKLTFGPDSPGGPGGPGI